MADTVDKGVLLPDDVSVSVERRVLDARFDALARQVWLPRWSVPPGRSTTRPVLQYPAVNVAVEADIAWAYLPAPGLTSRELVGSGWAAGLLLRPGAGGLLFPIDHSTALDSTLPIPHGADLVDEIRRVMAGGGGVEGVVSAYEQWLTPWVARVDDETLLVNAVVDAAETDPDLVTVTDLADRFGLGERALQRLVRRRVGFTPLWLIQRRRLHEASHRLRHEPATPLAQIATDVGYSDQAHFNRDFKAAIGVTPGQYRRSVHS